MFLSPELWSRRRYALCSPPPTDTLQHVARAGCQRRGEAWGAKPRQPGLAANQSSPRCPQSLAPPRGAPPPEGGPRRPPRAGD
ncbi:unnamed protein product [Gadus morhua 'NCC']